MPHPQPLSPRLDRLRRWFAERSVPAVADPSLRWAAVAVILVPSPDAVLLIRRAERSGDPWSGHIALPGGRHNPGDAGLAATAARETEEEVGCRLDRGDLLGALDDVVPSTRSLPPIAIRPFVFLRATRPRLTPNHEVADTRWVPFDQLQHPETYRPTRIEVRGARREFPAYRVGDLVIWGLTERILSGLLERV